MNGRPPPLDPNWQARQAERQREIAAEQAREQQAAVTAPLQPHPDWDRHVENPGWGGRPDWHHDQDGGDRRPDWQPQGNFSMGFNLNDIVTVLKNAGITGTTLTTAVSTLASNSPSTALHNYAMQVLSNSGNPTVVKDLAVKMAEVPNLPNGVMPYVSEIGNAADPAAVLKAVTDLESFLKATSGFSGFHLGF